jgi:hypothetical protein
MTTQAKLNIATMALRGMAENRTESEYPDDQGNEVLENDVALDSHNELVNAARAALREIGAEFKEPETFEESGDND